MKFARELEVLKDLQRRVTGIIEEGRETLGFPDASQWRALALARWEMMQALNRFVEFKQAHILDPIIAEGEDDTAEQASRLWRSNVELRREYEHFASRWALTSPLSVHEAYKAEAFAMAERIERQVGGEVREFEALLQAR